jgi:23S rRNA pseudouridine2605 synthase
VPVSPLPPNDGGLELLTNDGDLAQALMRKLSQLRIEFAVRARGEPRPEQLERLRSGILENGETVRIESLEAAGGEGANRWYTLVTRGGRARDVHRLFATAGVDLSRLMRVALGPVKMERGLARERSRALEPAEMTELYALAGLTGPQQHSHGKGPQRRSHPRKRAPGPQRTRLKAGRRRATGSRNSDR